MPAPNRTPRGFTVAAAQAQTSPPLPNAFLREGALSLLLFLLLGEWLRTLLQLSEASNVSNMKPFLIVFGISIALHWLRVSVWLGWLIKAGSLLIVIGFLFYPAEYPGLAWLPELGAQLMKDTVNIFQGNLAVISSESRTLLFIMGWLLVITVTQALMLQRQHALWFIMATLLYLVLLQWLFSMDTTEAIVRTLGCGLLLMALLNLLRIEQSYQVRSRAIMWPAQWLMLSLFAAAVLVTIGWVGHAAYAGQLIKPINGFAVMERLENYLGLNVQPAAETFKAKAKSGYGTDDSLLGGPLISDDQLIFTAKTEQITYWRGESKSLYDGKGWSGTAFDWTPIPALAGAKASSQFVIQEVIWNQDAPTKQIFHGGTLERVDALMTKQDKPYAPDMLLMDADSGKIALPVIADALSYYRIAIAPIEVNPADLHADLALIPNAIRDSYLQLPANLPLKIRQLAEQVTAGTYGPYNKAIAIEHYLRSTYAYSLDKPTHPARNEDFVSHFLFVDQTGYCDHFSTAMVVMLRSIGIPARWVKGFAPGTEDPGYEPDMHRMEIRAKDAHSWVEVYFPSSGWLPFEPTPGFTDTTFSQPEPAAASKLIHAPYLIPDEGWWGQWRDRAADLAAAYTLSMNRLMALLHNSPTLTSIVMGVVGLLLAIAILFVFWPKKRPVYLPSRSAHFMERLWMRIFRTFGNKQTHQTLREYIEGLQLADETQKHALLALAYKYEEIRYQPSQRAYFTQSEMASMWKWVQSSNAKSNSR